MTPTSYSVTELYKTRWHLVLFACVKYVQDKELGKDCAGEIFLELLEHPEKLNGVQNIDGWLNSYCRNYCFNRLRKFSRNRKHVEAYTTHTTASEAQRLSIHTDWLETELTDNEKEQFKQALQLALNELKLQHRTCIYQSYFLGMTAKEIEAATPYNSKQIDNYLYYGKKRLAKILDNHGWNTEIFHKLF